MKRVYTRIFALAFAVIMASCGNTPKEVESIGIAEIVFSSDTIIPGNIAMSSDGRTFITVNPLTQPYTKVYEIGSEGVVGAYPNDEYVTGENSIIAGVIGVRVDSNDNLWLLDMENNKFVVWDISANELMDVIELPDSVLVENSFLQDFVIDEKNGRVIIADMTMGSNEYPVQPAFVVLDLKNGNINRMAEGHLSMLADIDGGFALNPIAIDTGFNWVYFGALNGKNIYRVPAASFDNEELLMSTITEFGNKSYSDGIVVDEDQNIYITNIEDQAIAIIDGNGFRNIAMLPEGQVWPDGLFIGSDGYIYATVSQLNRSPALNQGQNGMAAPYIIVRTVTE